MTHQPPVNCTTIYYDGECPICQREIGFYKQRADSSTLTFVDATTCNAEDFGPGLSRDQALKRIHVRRADGQLVSGAAAFANVWQAIPGFRLLGRMAAWTPVTVLLEFGYRVTLKIRPRLQAIFRKR